MLREEVVEEGGYVGHGCLVIVGIEDGVEESWLRCINCVSVTLRLNEKLGWRSV